jgi:TonB family protein
MHTLKTSFIAVALTSSSTLALMLPHSASGAEPTHCAPQPANVRTQFPVNSQLRGEHGLVRLSVALSADGRASHVAVVESSGYRSLDRAAVNSVRKTWIFDVRHCTAAGLSAARTVDVVFRRAPGPTLSHFVSAKAVAQERMPCCKRRNRHGDFFLHCERCIARCHSTDSPIITVSSCPPSGHGCPLF